MCVSFECVLVAAYLCVICAKGAGGGMCVHLGCLPSAVLGWPECCVCAVVCGQLGSCCRGCVVLGEWAPG